MPDHFFVYPAYLSRSSSRALGRRIPAPDALEEITLDEIVGAAVKMGYRATAEPEKQYPRQAHHHAGRVRVQKRAGTSKTKFLKELAVALRKSRAVSGARP